MRPRLLLLLALAATVTLAACGSSSTSTTGKGSSAQAGSGSVTSPADASFLATLGMLCVHANDAFNNASGVPAQAAVVARYVAKFEALKPPAHLSALYSRYVGVLKQEAAALKAGNSAALGQLVTQHARPLAKQLGAKGCVT
jgi:ABC-type glycerol-3-phosphate transport system substrate-binding protein